MNVIMEELMTIEIRSEAEMKTFGEKLAKLLLGGDVVELIGDVGAGKTTLTKGLATGLGIDDDVQSPSFTISRVYEAGDKTLAHYDFYRLHDAGIMADELHETIYEPHTITVVEWAHSVDDVLPRERIVLAITPTSEMARTVAVTAPPRIMERL